MNLITEVLIIQTRHLHTCNTWNYNDTFIQTTSILRACSLLARCWSSNFVGLSYQYHHNVLISTLAGLRGLKSRANHWLGRQLLAAMSKSTQSPCKALAGKAILLQCKVRITCLKKNGALCTSNSTTLFWCAISDSTHQPRYSLSKFDCSCHLLVQANGVVPDNFLVTCWMLKY